MEVNDLMAAATVIYPPGNTTNWTYATFAISTAGLALSALAFGFLIFMAVQCEPWRRAYKNQLLVQLTAARFLYSLLRYISNVAGSLHLMKTWLYTIMLMTYTELALVIWMFFFSKQMYDSIVTVVWYKKEHQFFKTCLIAWTLPIPLSVFTCISMKHYDQYLVFLSYIFVFKWPVIVANAVILNVVLVSALRNKKRVQSNLRIVVVMFSMIFMFCVQLIMQDLYVIVYHVLSSRLNDFIHVMHIVFLVFNMLSTYQCPLSIFFWLFANAESRKLLNTTLGTEPRVVSYLPETSHT